MKNVIKWLGGLRLGEWFKTIHCVWAKNIEMYLGDQFFLFSQSVGKIKNNKYNCKRLDSQNIIGLRE